MSRRPNTLLAVRFLALFISGVLGGMVTASPRATAAELVMFVEAGCPWCVRWEREVGEAYIHSQEGRIAPLRRVDIADARRSGVRLASVVNLTPTFVLAEDGVEVGRITGYPGADFFWGMLGELMARLPVAGPRPPGGRPSTPGRQTYRWRSIVPLADLRSGTFLVRGMGGRYPA